VFYHLSNTSSFFCSGCFGDRILLFCPGQPRLPSSCLMLPTIAGMTGVYHHTCFFFFFLLRWSLTNCFPRAGLELQYVWAFFVPWDDRHTPLLVEIQHFFLGWPQTLIIMISASQVARIAATGTGFVFAFCFCLKQGFTM
jgi:hypothetical protein